MSLVQQHLQGDELIEVEASIIHAVSSHARTADATVLTDGLPKRQGRSFRRTTTEDGHEPLRRGGAGPSSREPVGGRAMPALSRPRSFMAFIIAIGSR